MFHQIHNFMLPCPVKALTGHDCPGCGMQRAIVSLFKGDLAESIHTHPAAIPLVFLVVFFALHMKFNFKFGNRLLLWNAILVGVITIVFYLFKMSGHPL